MAHLDFFFDLSSPYSYLASTQLAGLAERTGATIDPKPFVLFAVFKAVGSTPPKDVAQKAMYLAKDVPAWARTYGVPFRWPSGFPLNAMKAHRMLVAVDDPARRLSLAQRFFGAFWGDDADLTDDAVLARLATAAGHDGATLLAATERQDVKDRLRANTDLAIERGAFGAPTFFVGDEMFVGNDRLAFVERALRGERIYGESI